MRRAGRGTLLAVVAPLAAACLSVSVANAATIETTVAGLKLVLLDKYSLGKAKAVYVAKSSGVGSHGAAGDPPGVTGTIQIFPLSDPSNRAVYALPADWKVNKTNVAKYVNKLSGPGTLGAKVAVQKPTLVQKAVAKNLGDGDSASGSQSANDLNLQAITGSDVIRVVLTIVNSNDGNTYVSCSDFNTLSIKLDNSSQPFKVLSKSSVAPGTCAVGPTTTTTSSTTTTTTTLACCGTFTKLSFTTGVGSGNCGTLTNANGTLAQNLACGGLYVGSGLNSVPLPLSVPDMGQSILSRTACAANVLTLGPATSGTTGSNRNCSATGCLFGAPLPIPNSASTPTSTCVINSLTSGATGTANCTTGASSTSVPLNSQIFLAGDKLPGVGGIQPCPICTVGPNTCNGGPNHGDPCTAGTGALNASFPTSHDCPPDPIDDIGGLPIPLSLTTGTQAKTAVNLGDQVRVFCGFCRDGDVLGGGTLAFQNPFVACNVDADCTNPSFPSCEQRNSGAFSFATARTISVTGVPSGSLLDGLPHASTLVSNFCVPPTFNSTVDNAADLPGPGTTTLAGQAQLLP